MERVLIGISLGWRSSTLKKSAEICRLFIKTPLSLKPSTTSKSFGKQTLNSRLSTSNVPGSCIYGGFGNVVPDGYGACYIFKKERIDITVCSETTCPETSSVKFAESLVAALREMGDLLTEMKKHRDAKL